MKVKLTLITFATIIIITACHTSKKGTTSNTSSTPVAAANTLTVNAVGDTKPFVAAAKPANGIYEPGNEELLAIQPQYSDITLNKLKEGYVLYAKSACISCHEAQNIYRFDDMKWRLIIDNMAEKAKLSPDQKAAVSKYVFSIRATKPK